MCTHTETIVVGCVIKPRCMCEDYGSCCVCMYVCVWVGGCVCVWVCVFVCVTMLAATYLVYISNVRQYAVSCRLLKCGLR